MNIPKITRDIKQHNKRIIEILSSENWDHFRQYFFIREKFARSDFDDGFKCVFCSFYGMNGVTGLKVLQKEKFFQLLSQGENDLESILRGLYEIPGHKAKKKLFFSFATKLLHTRDKKLPIYDSHIANILELPPLAFPNSIDKRVKQRIVIYEKLKNDFTELLRNREIKNFLKEIRRQLKENSRCENFSWQDNHLSEEKLLDSVLWALPIAKKVK